MLLYTVDTYNHITHTRTAKITCFIFLEYLREVQYISKPIDYHRIQFHPALSFQDNPLIYFSSNGQLAIWWRTYASDGHGVVNYDKIQAVNLDVVDLHAPRIEKRQLLEGTPYTTNWPAYFSSHKMTPKYLAGVTPAIGHGTAIFVYPAVPVKGSRRLQFSLEKRYVRVEDVDASVILAIDDNANRIVVLSDKFDKLYLYQMEWPELSYKAQHRVRLSGKFCTMDVIFVLLASEAIYRGLVLLH